MFDLRLFQERWDFARSLDVVAGKEKNRGARQPKAAPCAAVAGQLLAVPRSEFKEFLNRGSHPLQAGLSSGKHHCVQFCTASCGAVAAKFKVRMKWNSSQSVIGLVNGICPLAGHAF